MKNQLLCCLLLFSAVFACKQEEQNEVVPTTNEGLVAHYPMNGNADDYSGNSNHGNVMGAMPTVGRNGQANTAYLFNGSSNLISFPKPFFDGKKVSQFSLSITFKLNTLSTGPSTIWAKNGYWQGAGIVVTPEGKLQFGSSIPTNQYQTCTSVSNVIEPNKWYNFVMIYDNINCTFYLNGTIILTKNVSLNQGGGIISEYVAGFVDFAQTAGGNSGSTNLVGCGNSISTGNTGFMSGLVDEFRLYNRLLTETEVLYLAKN